MKNLIEQSFLNLRQYCEKEDFSGWDPYDGLNSKVFNAIPSISKISFFKLAWIQFLKKNPFNLRKLLLVEKQKNPKALALFLSGYTKLYQIIPEPEILSLIQKLQAEIIHLASKAYSGICWGYPFDWQSRTFFQPKNTPTVVVTSFVGHALLDSFEVAENQEYLEKTFSIAHFILHDLKRTPGIDDTYSLSYSPLDSSAVYNAGLLGAGILARIGKISENKKYFDDAQKIVAFNVSKQNSDGSWYYSDLPHHRWIDNFHTGFNLESIARFQQYSQNFEFNNALESGFIYYINNFFTRQGISKYYHNQTYPVDTHAPAQLIVTLSKLGKFSKHKAMADKVLKWAIENMQDKRGYFYYQKGKGFTNKIPYMRWAQAWMFNALSTYLFETNKHEIAISNNLHTNSE